MLGLYIAKIVRVAKHFISAIKSPLCLYIAKIVRVAKPGIDGRLIERSLYIAKIVRVAKLELSFEPTYELSLHSKNCEGSKTQ